MSVVKIDVTTAAPHVSQETRLQLKQACEEFESIFISMVFRQMMESIPKSNDSNPSSGILSGIADEAVGRYLAKSGGFGLQESLMRELLKAVRE